MHAAGNDPREKERGALLADKARAARELARSHFDAEPRLLQILHFAAEPKIEARPSEPIKLLEVIADARVAARLTPIRFAPSPAVPFAVALIEVSPDDLQRIAAEQLKLPGHWQTGQDLPRSDRQETAAPGQGRQE